jgi:hypothetical protein
MHYYSEFQSSAETNSEGRIEVLNSTQRTITKNFIIKMAAALILNAIKLSKKTFFFFN